MAEIGLVDEKLTRSVIGVFYDVYNTLGYGFLEHIYKAALDHELRAQGHRVAREVSVTVLYKEIELGSQRLDMLVDERLVVEVKCRRDKPDFGSAQLFNYLRATNLEVGLLLHFGPRPSFRRIVCLNSWRGSAVPLDEHGGAG